MSMTIAEAAGGGVPLKIHYEDFAKQEIALKKLREPFPPEQISKKPQPLKKDAPKGRCPECAGWHGMPAIHLDYVGHAALTQRLLEVDPFWNWEPMSVDETGLPRLDSNGGMWIRLTVCGMTRLGYGDSEGKTGPSAMKERIGDALRNAAMRFGAALDLWSKAELRPQTLSPEKFEEIKQSFNAAIDLPDLAKVAAGAGEYADDEQRQELRDLYTACKKQLTAKAKKKEDHGTDTP